MSSTAHLGFMEARSRARIAGRRSSTKAQLWALNSLGSGHGSRHRCPRSCGCLAATLTRGLDHQARRRRGGKPRRAPLNQPVRAAVGRR
jgi:hypothetical protein